MGKGVLFTGTVAKEKQKERAKKAKKLVTYDHIIQTFFRIIVNL